MEKTVKTPNWSYIRKDSQISIYRAFSRVLFTVLTCIYTPFHCSFARKEEQNAERSVPLFSWVELIDVFMATNNVSVNSYTDISTTDADEKSISTFFTSPY